MNVSRRQLCTSVVGATTAVTVGASKAAEAQDGITVKGQLTSEVSTELAGDYVYLVNPADRSQKLDSAESEFYGSAVIQPNGEFSGSIPEVGRYELMYFNSDPRQNLRVEPDGLPMFEYIGLIPITEGGDIGEFTISQAHDVSMRFVNEDGNPVENLPVSFRSETGRGLQPGEFNTNSDGYLKHLGASQPGVEMIGNLRVEVKPPDNPDNYDEIREISVTSSRELVFRIRNPTQYPFVSVNGKGTETNTEAETTPSSDGESDTTPSSDEGGDTTVASADGEPEASRGFLSNRAPGEEPTGPLSNAVNITTLGFLLSVVGIAYQLIEGR